MLNPFFLQGSTTEQGLVQDLINEQIRMYGIDVHYIPRRYVTERTVIKEVIESVFDNAYPIEAYVNSYEGYGDNTAILSKFGIQSTNELSLIISKERFETYITPIIKNIPDIKLASRPKEGDLIYFPLGDRLFEIKYVEHEQPFYQLQKNYVYELKCELFRYEDEVIDTSIEEIDDNIEKEGYIQTLNLLGIGITAQAYTSLTSGGVRKVSITNGGSGYTSPPTVAFSVPSTPSLFGYPQDLFGYPSGAVAVGTAIITNGLVSEVQIINPGYGYTSNPMVKFIGGGGSGAVATASTSNGGIGIVTIGNAGALYSLPPQVGFTTSSGNTAIATAVVTNGSISQIRILDSGSGYDNPPYITIGDPSLVGFGTYIYNEVVVGAISSTSARVRSWNSVNKQLEIATISGDFQVGEIIIGSDSGAMYRLYSSNDDYDITTQYNENKVIQEEADNILDFTERNPFGVV